MRSGTNYKQMGRDHVCVRATPAHGDMRVSLGNGGNLKRSKVDSPHARGVYIY